ncbi:MAG TPA: LuxR C-terminal-related transcriptional regulator [Chloroflexota bacterium]
MTAHGIASVDGTSREPTRRPRLDGVPRLPTPDVRGNLPRDLTSFVGRQAQLAEITRMLNTAPLLTLVGVGGIGKTRLALRVAADAHERYAHGAWLVELASIGDPSEVAPEVARTLRVRERAEGTALQTLASILRTRQLLLVIDNCEHVLPACVELAAALLQTCPDLTILATSREPLGVAGEALYQVPPLSMPTVENADKSVAKGEAIELLVERVRAVEPSFRLTPVNVDSGARICQLLDGLPLAIELAAARTMTMSLAEVADELHAPFRLLTLGPRSAPTRQRTLRAAIDWSYQLLTDPERVLLRRLAIFVSGWSRAAATAVCAGRDMPAERVDDLLDRLVAQSLVVAVKRDERTRFHLLETLRQYLLARLEEAGELTMLRERHVEWCLQLVADVVVESLDADQVARLEPDLDNLRSALRWTFEQGRVDAAVRLVLGLANSWWFHGSFSEGRSWLTAVFDLASSASPSPEPPLAGVWAGVLAFNQGDYSGAEALYHRAFDVAQASGNEYAVTLAESRLGRLAYQRGDLAQAKKLQERTLQRLANTGSPWETITVADLGFTYLQLGDRTRASQYFRALSDKVAETHSRFLSARLLNVRAHEAEMDGNYAEADRLLAEAVDAQRAAGDEPGVIESLKLRGAVAVHRGDRQLAALLLLEAMDLVEQFGSRMRLIRLFEALASLFVESRPEACIRLAAAAEQLRMVLGAVPLPTDQARLGRYLQTARQRLGQRAYGAIWEAAASAPVETTLLEARQLLNEFQVAGSPRTRPAPSGAGALSPREQEVAILVARGLSNRQIGEELVVTAKTAEAHVNHILTKLGLSNRVQIATWATRHGLLTV